MDPDKPAALRWRPTLSVEALLLLASVAFAAFYNGALWALLFGTADLTKPRTAALFIGLFIAVVGIQFAGLALLLTRRTAGPPSIPPITESGSSKNANTWSSVSPGQLPKATSSIPLPSFSSSRS